MKNEKDYTGFLIHKVWQILKHFSRALTQSVRKNLTKNASGQNHRSLWFTLESFSPIKEITKIYQLQIFSCLFTFYSHLSRICWKNKCYKKQVPSNFFTLLRSQEINFYAYFHNQLKKVWNVNFWGQNSGLSFHQISTLRNASTSKIINDNAFFENKCHSSPTYYSIGEHSEKCSPTLCKCQFIYILFL